METITLTGFTARNTDKAIAFTASSEDGQKPLWIPRSKITSFAEGDGLSVAQQYEGETIVRQAVPCQMQVSLEFLAKIAPYYIPR